MSKLWSCKNIGEEECGVREHVQRACRGDPEAFV